ncbi:hypothetical protein AAHA92_21271 [Salvia divinorum]|uniref:Uncharacterized protein n=1 Tax=Salvia divinorum TaxID=28513 RepID=A0ABD1GJX2_SALDI
MIECENKQWEQIIKVDGNTRSIRNKSWPYWEDWKEIFGHNRTNGLNSEDILESINVLDGHDNIGNMRVDGDYHVNLEDILANENAQDTRNKNIFSLISYGCTTATPHASLSLSANNQITISRILITTQRTKELTCHGGHCSFRVQTLCREILN